MSNYVFLAQHYQLFNELLDINKKISLVLSVIQSNEVTLSELKIKLSTLLGDSLTEMEIEKIKSVDDIVNNSISFIDHMIEKANRIKKEINETYSNFLNVSLPLINLY